LAGEKEALKPVTPQAQAFLDEVLDDSAQPVVMFALAWCEFCWSVRKMFATTRIAHRSVGGGLHPR